MEELKQLTKILMQHTVCVILQINTTSHDGCFSLFLQLQRCYVYHNHSKLGVIQSQTRCDLIMRQDIHDYSSCGFALECYVTMTCDGYSSTYSYCSRFKLCIYCRTVSTVELIRDGLCVSI